jgi:hypothetical protein
MTATKNPPSLTSLGFDLVGERNTKGNMKKADLIRHIAHAYGYWLREWRQMKHSSSNWHRGAAHQSMTNYRSQIRYMCRTATRSELKWIGYWIRCGLSYV